MTSESRQAARKPRVLFLCTGNSCRSQMAEGWVRHLYGQSIEAYSAGTAAYGLNPDAVAVMREAGVDIRGQASKTLNQLPVENFDLVVTLCDNAAQACPSVPGASRVIHMPFEDPPRLAAGELSRERALDHYRRVRDAIRLMVEKLPNWLEDNPVNPVK